MIILQKLYQIPRNCQCKRLSAFPTVRETFVNAFTFPEKFSFSMGTTDSIEQLNLVQRLNVGGCLEIHILR